MWVSATVLQRECPIIEAGVICVHPNYYLLYAVYTKLVPGGAFDAKSSAHFFRWCINLCFLRPLGGCLNFREGIGMLLIAVTV
jgi:hypothetical protein